MNLFERIDKERKKRNMSQQDLCNNANISTSTYSSWKNLNREPSYNFLIKTAELFQTSIDWLITGKEDPDPEDLNQEEMQLLSYYRDSNKEGKERIQEQAEFIQSKYPAFPNNRKSETA